MGSQQDSIHSIKNEAVIQPSWRPSKGRYTKQYGESGHTTGVLIRGKKGMHMEFI
jgi:hypothetical protein